MLPALVGDGNGIYRVKVVGNSGAGKTTLGRLLAKTLGVDFISLDEIWWKPNWEMTPRDEFRESVRELLEHHEKTSKGWVIDGNFSAVTEMVEEAATDIIWLDPPFMLYFPRLVKRTLLRLVRAAPPCSPGCNESLRSIFFDKESIIVWCWTHHTPIRKKMTDLMNALALRAATYDSIEHTTHKRPPVMRRLGGWGAEAEEWWKNVERMFSKP